MMLRNAKMTATNDPHQKARRLVQLGLDGLLERREADWLRAHLGTCAACQQFADQTHGLDLALRRDFAAQREAAAHPHHLSVFALQSIQDRKRANMHTRQLKSFANAVISLTLLAALAGGLIWLFSTGMPQAAPLQTGSGSPSLPPTATAVMTPTPVPPPPVNTHAQIIAALSALADSEIAAYQGTFWVHRVTQDLTEQGSGALSGAFIEEWLYLVDGQCRESLVVSRDRPQGSTLYNLQVGLADGVYGDLVELRDGRAVGSGSLRTDWRCNILAADTDAGVLAARLKSGPEQLLIKGPNEVKDLRAWYDALEGRTILVVEATFTGEGNIPEVQRETRYFDLQTGRMLQEKTVMEWADGRPFGEFSRSKSTEFLDEMPAETAELFEQSKAELLTYLDPNAHPTATPLPTVLPGALDGLAAYTVDAPLSRSVTIGAVLQALLQRNIDWVSQPGWVLHHPKPADGQKWDATYSVLAHVLSDGSCEKLEYYVKDGRILPQSLYLANGDWILIGSVQDGVVTEGKTAEYPCRSENFHTVELLRNEIDSVNEVIAGEAGSTLQAWVETRVDRPVLVLYTDQVYSGMKPSTMDPDTRQLEPQDRSQTWTFFDLETGSYAGAAYLAHLSNGKVFGEPYQPGGALAIETVRYDPLPADLAAAFDQTLAALKIYLSPRP